MRHELYCLPPSPCSPLSTSSLYLLAPRYLLSLSPLSISPLLHLPSPHFTPSISSIPISSTSTLLTSPPPDDNHWSSKASQATNSSGPLSSELLGDVAGADVIIIDDIVGTYMCLYVGGGGRGYIGLYLI